MPPGSAGSGAHSGAWGLGRCGPLPLWQHSRGGPRAAQAAEPYWSLVTAILASCHIQNTTFHGRPIPMNDQLIISTPHAWGAPAFASCIVYLLSLLRLHVALVTCCQAATVAVHFVVLE